MIDGPDITADWLTSALRASIPDVAVRAVEIEKIGTGQTGASYRLHLDDDGLPPTLVAKTAAGDRAASRGLAGFRADLGERGAEIEPLLPLRGERDDLLGRIAQEAFDGPASSHFGSGRKGGAADEQGGYEQRK